MLELSLRERAPQNFGVVFHYQYPQRYSPHVSLQFGERPLRDNLVVF